MSHDKRLSLMPTRTRYRLLATFCLTSLIPILSGVYIGSLFVKYPFDTNPLTLATMSFILLFSLLLSFLGHQINKALVFPIEAASASAKKIAAGELAAPPALRGSDELEDLSHSLQTISENARELLEKVEKLSLKDKLTGLYKAHYIQERLSEEIQRSIHYQRPCAFVYFHIESPDAFVSGNGAIASEDLLKEIAKILSRHLSDLDRAARIHLNEFAIIFADQNKKKAIASVDAIIREIKSLLSKKSAEKPDTVLNVFAGISENPIDGVTSDDLYLKAQDRMRAAKAARSESVEAFA